MINSYYVPLLMLHILLPRWGATFLCPNMGAGKVSLALKLSQSIEWITTRRLAPFRKP